MVSPLPDVPHQTWPLGRFPSPSISAMGDTRFFASSETRIPTQHSQCHLLCPQQPRNSTQLLVDLNVKSPSPRKSTCLDAPCLNPSPVLTLHRATQAAGAQAVFATHPDFCRFFNPPFPIVLHCKYTNLTNLTYYAFQALCYRLFFAITSEPGN